MKYEVSATINKPLQEVVEKYDSLEGLKHWQPGFLGMEPLEGELGAEGSKAKLKFEMRGKEMEMIETVKEKDLPRVMTLEFEVPGMWNSVATYFEDAGEGKTLLRTENDFRGQSFMMKVFVKLMPGMFKKQSQKYLDYFKAYVEEGKSVLDDADSKGKK